MRRVGDVFDCWFESGSMPYAQIHYPFDNKEWFENHFPADFIVEAMDQTRGWFYTLTVLSTALHNRPAFKNCVCTGLLMAEGGQKLSKRLKNYPDPNEVLDSIGSDALRWFLVSSPVLKGGNLAVDKEGKEIAKAARVAQIPLWNAFYFFTLYANAENYAAKEVFSSTEAMDNYILSKLKHLAEVVKKGIETYDVAMACNEIASFIEILNNWYIRRTRDRFWEGEALAFDVLYTVLLNLSKIAAPLMPFVSEYVYRTLNNGGSVHLTDYPTLSEIKFDKALVEDMDFLQDLCSAAKFIREEKNLRNRLPLSKLTVVGKELPAAYVDIIKDELNVKAVDFDNNLSAYAEKKIYLYTPLLGKALGKDMGAVMAAYKQGAWSLNADGTLAIGGQNLTSDLFEVRLEMKAGVAGKAFADNKALVTLDTTVTDALKREGMARDFVRMVQTLRKDKDFNISDRIELSYATDNAELALALDENGTYIAEQVLAVRVHHDCSDGIDGDIEGITIRYNAKVA
jgi:isoleucyl-tRNA synthetase